MATSTLNPVLDHLRSAVLLRDGAGLTDAQLLEAVVSRKDEAAFAALVRRHGPMVLGVCRRVLHNHHDCEDAFQATFLVLFRKADSIAPQGMVANWLYGVAYRTALKARSIITRHSVRERQVTDMPEPEAAEPDDCGRDLQPLLDQEMSRLPDKYRVPIVLCDLQGQTGKNVARQLGWPEGTVASRLSRGRIMLAKRLSRHGLVLSAGSLAVALSQNAASACVPASLVSSTIKAASFLAAGQALTPGLVTAKVAALMEGVLKAMLLTKIKSGIVLFLALGFLIASLGVHLTYRTEAAGSATATLGTEHNSDKDRLQGTWQQVSCEGNDKVTDDNVKKTTLVVKDDTITVQTDGKFSYALTFKLDEGKNPKTVDEFLIKPEKGNKPYLGIYALDGDTLKFCFSDPGKKRPTKFTGGADSGWTLTVFQRKQLGTRKKGDVKPEEKKLADQDQAKQILDMVLKGFQAYQSSKGSRDQDQNSAKKEMEKLQGTWRVVSSQVGDEKAAEDEVKKRKVTVKGDRLIYEYGNEQKEKQEGTIKLDPKTKAFDWAWTSPGDGGTMLGIYELKGDDLKIGFGNDGLVRPRQFVIGKEDVVWLLVLKREKTEMRWRLRPGEKHRYTIDEKTGIKLKTRDKGSFIMSQRLVLETTWTVQGVDRLGKAAVSVVIDRIRFQADGSADAMEVQLKYDSRDGKEPKDQVDKSVSKMFQAMVGRPITLEMSSLGELRNVKMDEKTRAALASDIGRELSGFFGDTFAPEGIKRRLSDAMVILPRESLDKGGFWKQRASANTNQPVASYLRTYTYKGTEIKQGRELERFDVHAGFVPQGDKGLKVKEQRGQGVVYFDNKAGRMVTSELRFRLSFDDDFLIQSESEWALRVECRRD